MSRFHPPDRFDFSDTAAWQDWIERVQQYRELTKLHKGDDDVQIATLVYCTGPQANVVFKQVKFDDGDREKYDKVVENLTGHFKPISKVVHKRAMFERATQNPSESIDEYLIRLHRTADKC